MSVSMISVDLDSTLLLNDKTISERTILTARSAMARGAISGTTITAGPDTRFSTTDYSGYRISAVLLSNGNVFVAHSYGSSYDFYAMICTTNGMTISTGNDIYISRVSKQCFQVSAVLLPGEFIFVSHVVNISDYYSAYGVICAINGTEITHEEDLSIIAASYTTVFVIDSILLPNGNVFIAHGYSTSFSSNVLRAIIVPITIYISPTTSLSDSAGVAKTAATAGNNVEIYTPI